MKFTVSQIATYLAGIIEGNPDINISNISKIDEGIPGTITFLSNPSYTKYIYTTEASVVLVHKDFIPDKTINPTLIRVDDPYLSFSKLIQMMQGTVQSKPPKISETAIYGNSVEFEDKSSVWLGDYVVIGEHVRIGKNVLIYPHVFVDDNSIIGENTVIYSGVKIYSHTVIGKNCIIHSGVVLGSDGFGYAQDIDKQYKKIPHAGNTVLEDYVEIGSNTTIDRATVGSTVIKSGVKLDNLIQVAHNCELGCNTVVASQTGFSGSVKIGENCMIGGQVGIVAHKKIGNNVKIAAQSGIADNIKDDAMVMGSPAIDSSEYKRAFVFFKNFEKIHKRLIVLEKKYFTK